MTTGVIDQDAAHDVRGDTKEMRPILPIHLPLIDEPDEHFVDERRRLEGVVSPFASQLTGCDATEFGVDEWQQLIERTPVAATPVAE